MRTELGEIGFEVRRLSALRSAEAQAGAPSALVFSLCRVVPKLPGNCRRRQGMSAITMNTFMNYGLNYRI